MTLRLALVIDGDASGAAKAARDAAGAIDQASRSSEGAARAADKAADAARRQAAAEEELARAADKRAAAEKAVAAPGASIQWADPDPEIARRHDERRRAVLGQTAALKADRDELTRHAGAAREAADAGGALADAAQETADAFEAGEPARAGLLQGLAQVLPVSHSARTALSALFAVAGGGSAVLLALGAAIWQAGRAWQDHVASLKAVEAAAAGLGRAQAGLAADMEAQARAGAAAGDISVRAARGMQTEWLRTGRIGNEVFAGLTGIAKDFAVTLGTDLPGASEALARIFADPAAGARMLHRDLGLIDEAVARNVAALTGQNRMIEAQQALLEALRGRLVDASEATTVWGRAWDSVATGAANAWDWIGRAIERGVAGKNQAEEIDVLTAKIARLQAALDGLRSGRTVRDPAEAAALIPEIEAELSANQRRLDQLQGLADLERERTRIERDAASRSQVGARALSIAEDSPANASILRQRRLAEEIAALRSGLFAPDLSEEARGDIATAIEAKTRALDGLIARQERLNQLNELDIAIQSARDPLTRAELTALREKLRLAGEEVTAAEAAAAAQRAREAVLGRAIAGAENHAAAMREEAEARALLSDRVAAGEITTRQAEEMLRREAELRPLIAAAARAEGAEKEALIAVVDRLSAAYGREARERSRAAALDAIQAGADRLDRLRLEIALVGQSEERRRLLIAALEVEQDIRRRGLDIASAEAEGLRLNAELTTRARMELERTAGAWEKVKSAGEGAIDSIIGKIASGNFSGLLEELGRDLTRTLLDLGGGNYLKNALFGANLPTLSDLGRLFSGAPAESGAALAAQAIGAMNVQAGTVIVNGAVGAGAGIERIFAPANANVPGGVVRAPLPDIAGAASPVAGNGVREQIWNFFAGKGLAPHQIAGIVGHAGAESSFNPLAEGDKINGVHTSFGLFQHHAGRANALMNHIGGRQNLGDVQKQLEFTWKELQGPENAALKKLLASTNVRQATQAWGQFERPQGWSAANPEAMHNWTGRLAGAEKAMADFASRAAEAVPPLGQLAASAVDAQGGLGEFAADLTKGLGQLAGAAPGGGSGGGLFGSLLKWLFSGKLFARGGIAREPSIFGEAGAEAAVPLPDGRRIPVDLRTGPPATVRDSGEAPAPRVMLNHQILVEHYGRDRVTPEERDDGAGGKRTVLVIEDQMAAGATRKGSSMRAALESTFGLRARPRRL